MALTHDQDVHITLKLDAIRKQYEERIALYQQALAISKQLVSNLKAAYDAVDDLVDGKFDEELYNVGGGRKSDRDDTVLATALALITDFGNYAAPGGPGACASGGSPHSVTMMDLIEQMIEVAQKFAGELDQAIELGELDVED